MKLSLLRKFVLGLIFLNLINPMAAAAAKGNKLQLKFNSDGTFKIIQFADIHSGPHLDSKTLSLMNKILDFEKPDLVVLTGDNTDEKCVSAQDVRTAIQSLSRPMEEKRIPWAVVFGNHDENQAATGLHKLDMMKIYMSYPYNMSQLGDENINGIGNYNLLINSLNKNKPVLNIYFLDSGEYAISDKKEYDWIKPNQIQWYRETSMRLRKKYKSPIPSLMFFHIPLIEFKDLWKSGKAVGQRNESECTAKINSGLFAALLEMKDVLGVFVGHDHINDYSGDLRGIRLGYSRNVGCSTYGRDNFSRGARVFLLRESEPMKFDTWLRTASDFDEY